ncbi:MAG: TonB-dependent receptor [Cyclobacteriaceae bacterium]
MKITTLAFMILAVFQTSLAQRLVHGVVLDAKSGEGLPGASVFIRSNTQVGVVTDLEGRFELTVPDAAEELQVSFTGYERQTIKLEPGKGSYMIKLPAALQTLDEVTVVSGTLKEVSKLESPVPVEVYTPTFFMKNPAPSLFESMSNVNGVRPQLNCNVCNTGDIHINGLEGPYTMILIDGMPIVSGLSTVYGLTGIPASLIDRVEIVKGPASTLYGSEAVAGLINVITKRPSFAPVASADVMATSWGEVNTDLGLKFKPGPKIQSLLGVNYFNYQIPFDHNDDGFTDVTLQDRISVFNKLSFERKDNRIFTMGGRFNYEDRWGGELEWTPAFRGSDIFYGESIYTHRWEFMGTYQLPTTEKLFFNFSANGHDQNSYYGTTPYMANQKIAFGQLTWSKSAGRHDVVSGLALRYTQYDDNTVATESNGANNPSVTWLPGAFMQDEIQVRPRHKLLVGMRYDYNSIHGSIFTPRINYKWSSKSNLDQLRLSLGNGYRVANVFTEDHAALTGARTVVFLEDLKPETSWNVNLNYVKKILLSSGFIGFDATAFYTRFENKIFPDYTTHANQIIYSNLDGYGVSQGVSLNLDFNFTSGLKILAGGTLMDVSNTENAGGEWVSERQLLTERFTAVWSVSYPINDKLSVDYTGNLYGPMRLPVLGDLDPRRRESPVWSIQNIQLSQKLGGRWTIYGGVKNLLNYTPPRNSIARAHDPFDKQVMFDSNGSPVPTAENPYALTFDPSYVFAPNQGIRAFLGVRWIVE